MSFSSCGATSGSEETADEEVEEREQHGAPSSRGERMLRVSLGAGLGFMNPSRQRRGPGRYPDHDRDRIGAHDPIVPDRSSKAKDWLSQTDPLPSKAYGEARCRPT